MSAAHDIRSDDAPAPAERLVMEARGLIKRYGRVTALDHADFELRPNEILAVIAFLQSMSGEEVTINLSELATPASASPGGRKDL